MEAAVFGWRESSGMSVIRRRLGNAKPAAVRVPTRIDRTAVGTGPLWCSPSLARCDDLRPERDPAVAWDCGISEGSRTRLVC